MRPFTITVEHSSPAERTVTFEWDDGTPRDVSALSARATVYEGSGDETDVTFTLDAVPGEVATDKVFQFTSTETDLERRTSYMTIDLLDSQGQVAEDGRWHGTFLVSGHG